MKQSEATPAAISGVSRREFLRYGGAGGLGMWGLARADASGLKSRQPKRCLFILMSGGPSQLETFDPKPHAPSEIRGPYRPIATSVPGLWLSETLPGLAQRADRFCLMRSLQHSAAPLHETGLQLIQSGQLSRPGQPVSHLGAIVAASRTAAPGAFVILPEALQETGVHADKGQTAGLLPTAAQPLYCGLETGSDSSPLPMALPALDAEPAAVRLSYGSSSFGRACLRARQLIEAGTHFVCLNMFPQLAQRLSWDCHGHSPAAPTRLTDYGTTICPEFDRGLSALLDDLQSRQLLNDTLVVAVGEFGRTPKLNRQGGRDHWPRVWSALLAGAGLNGGQVIGSSDPHGAEPVDNPISPADFVATVLTLLDVDPLAAMACQDGQSRQLFPEAPRVLTVMA